MKSLSFYAAMLTPVSKYVAVQTHYMHDLTQLETFGYMSP